MQVARPRGRRCVQTRLTSRDGLCAAPQGLAPAGASAAAGEVLVSRRSASTAGSQPGTAVTSERAGDPTASGVRSQATVVGAYEPGRRPEAVLGRARGTTRGRPGRRRGTRRRPSTTSSRPGRPWPPETWPDLHDPPRHPAAAPSGWTWRDSPTCGRDGRVDARARTLGGSATSEIGPLLESTTAARPGPQRHPAPRGPARRARHRRAGVRLRRGDRAATARDRPGPPARSGSRGAAGMLLRELGCWCSSGRSVGAALGWLAAIGRGRAVAGARGDARGALAGAGGGRCGRGRRAARIVAAGAPTLRQPLTSLLRRVPPRASTLQVGLVEGAVVAAAAAGVRHRCCQGDGGPVPCSLRGCSPSPAACCWPRRPSRPPGRAAPRAAARPASRRPWPGSRSRAGRRCAG